MRPPRHVALGKAASVGTALMEEPTVHTDEGGSGAGDGVGKGGGIEGVAAVAGATVAALALVEGACEHAQQQQSYRPNASANSRLEAALAPAKKRAKVSSNGGPFGPLGSDPGTRVANAGREHRHCESLR